LGDILIFLVLILFVILARHHFLLRAFKFIPTSLFDQPFVLNYFSVFNPFFVFTPDDLYAAWAWRL
jgi:hypothetical protein